MNISQTLIDEREIVALTVGYAWAIDSRDWPALQQIFLPDATAKLGHELDGIDAIVERISHALTSLDVSQHIVANHQVVVDGDSATCRCYFQAQHVRAAAGQKGTGGVNYIVAGRYLDDVVRTAEGWRIKRRILMVDWTEGNTAVAFR